MKGLSRIRNKHIVLLMILALLSLLGNIYQYTYHLGYDANVSMVVEAYEVEQLENFDLNRTLHHRNLIVLDLQHELEECLSGQVPVFRY